MSSTPTRVAAGLLALVLPAVVLAAGLATLLAPRLEELSAQAQAMEQLVAEADPQVVFVGNSLVRMGIDADVVSTKLGARPVRVAKVFEPGTWPANWYSYLANRVYGTEHVPHAVVICTTPRMLLQPQLGSDLARKSLADHASSYEPVIFRKVYGEETPNPWLHRLRANRSDLQQLFQDRVRGWSVGLFQGEGEGSLAERGERVALPALAQVFGAEGAVDMSLHHRVIPVVEVERKQQVASGDSAVADSFVPDLLDLADSYGSRVVFVRMPMASTLAGSVAVDASTQAELVRYLNERGAAWLDLHDIDFADNLFMDPAHLNAQGRQRFSELVARELARIDVMEEGPFAPNTVPLALSPAGSRSGSPPAARPLTLRPDPDSFPCRRVAIERDLFPISDVALTSAGMGEVSPLVVLEGGRALARHTWPASIGKTCDGSFVPQAAKIWISPSGEQAQGQPAPAYTLDLVQDVPLRVGTKEAWWVYPGTTLTLGFDSWPGEPGSYTLQLGMEPLLGEPDGARATVDGKPIPLESQGRWLVGSLDATTPTGPWQVTVDSPADGPYLLLRWIGVASGDATADILGTPELLDPPTASLLVDPKRSKAHCERPPPPIDATPETAFRAKTARFVVPKYAELDDEWIQTRVPCRRCTPLRVAEDGVVHEKPLITCMPARGGKPHRSCQEGEQVLFTASDSTPPLDNGRSYRLTLAPDRQIGRFWWLYPGDLARLPAINRELRALRDGASHLSLEAKAFAGHPDNPVTLELRIGEVVVAQAELTAGELDQGPLEIDFPPTPVSGQEVELTLESGLEAPFMLVTTAVLRE